MDINCNIFFNTNEYESTGQELGDGAFSKVLAFKKKSDGTIVAIKLLKFKGKFEGNDQMNFLRESLILSKLNHPSIVKFIGINFQAYPVNETNKSQLLPAIITEYLPNGSIQKLMNNLRESNSVPKLNATLKFIWLLGISNAMMYLHKNGIIHRDLKPDNILLDENFYPRICDFGLSRKYSTPFTNSNQLSVTFVGGTFFYMAPEALFSTKITSSVDVYSFAIIAYEIISERKPYDDQENFYGKIKQGLRPSIENHPLFTEKMKVFLNNCWSEDVKSRPSFEDIFETLRKNCNEYSAEELDCKKIAEYLEKYCMDVTAEPECDPSQQIKTLQKEKCDLIKEKKQMEKKYHEFENDYFIRSSTIQSYLTGLIRIIGNKSGRNLKGSILNLQAASEKGNSDASFVLGLLYESGEIGEENIGKALYYFELSGKQNNSRGYQRLGTIYMTGLCNQKKDFKKAKDFFIKAIEMNDTAAMINLGKMYKDGMVDSKVDYNKAKVYFKTAALLGNLHAWNYLGLLYMNGFGVKKNFPKAKKCFEEACKEEPNAWTNLGILYMHGDVEGDLNTVKKGVSKNLEEARKCFEEAAKFDIASSLYYLGHMYEKGNGVNKDIEKAKNYYARACKLGYEKAVDKMKLLIESAQAA